MKRVTPTVALLVPPHLKTAFCLISVVTDAFVNSGDNRELLAHFLCIPEVSVHVKACVHIFVYRYTHLIYMHVLYLVREYVVTAHLLHDSSHYAGTSCTSSRH